MKFDEIKKLIKPLGKLFGVAVGAAVAGELAHRGKEANTRKKAMDAAVRKNNQAVAKKEEESK